MWLLGVVVRRYIDFLILLIPTPLVSVLFAAVFQLFVHFVKCFFDNNNNYKMLQHWASEGEFYTGSLCCITSLSWLYIYIARDVIDWVKSYRHYCMLITLVDL